MNKLGFAIKLASKGASNAIECNKGQWTNKVVDIREYLKLFNGLQGTDNIVTFMSFDESGCFLTQLRAISGRIGDFLSGWIYIPNTIEASGEDVMNTYNYVRNILFQSNLNDYFSDIDSFFSKEYPVKEYAASYVPSSGEEFGVRFIDMYYSMKEILDTDRYQPYYSNYKAIFLLDKEGEVSISKEHVGKFKDLTKLQIDTTCVFKAPSLEEVRLLGRGAKIVFPNNQEFKSPVLTKKGDKIQLCAVRDGFEPVVLPLVVIQEDGQMLSIQPKTVRWMRRIKPSMFQIYNRKHEKIEKGVRILVNGTDVTYQEVLVSEDNCRQANIKIIATDYEVFEQKQNLLNDYCEVILNRRVKSLRKTIELADGSLAEMTIESKTLSSIHESPLKGYEYEEEILKMSSWFVWKQRFLGLIGGFVLIALFLVITAIPKWLDGSPASTTGNVGTSDDVPTSNESGHTTIQDPEEESNEDASDTYSLEDAINYLDKNKVWSKSELDKYPELRGLYEDMNNFDLERLVDYWYPSLSESEQFAKIKDSAKKSLDKGWNPKQDPHSDAYNKDGDEQINTVNYVNWLDQDRSPKTKKTESGFHIDKVKDVGTHVGNSSTNAGRAAGNSGSGNSGSGNPRNERNGGL